MMVYEFGLTVVCFGYWWFVVRRVGLLADWFEVVVWCWVVVLGVVWWFLRCCVGFVRCGL